MTIHPYRIGLNTSLGTLLNSVASPEPLEKGFRRAAVEAGTNGALGVGKMLPGLHSFACIASLPKDIVGLSVAANTHERIYAFIELIADAIGIGFYPVAAFKGGVVDLFLGSYVPACIDAFHIGTGSNNC